MPKRTKICYEYLYIGHGQFQVIKRWEEEGRVRCKTYSPSYKKGRWCCDCEWGLRQAENLILRPCRHVKDIIAMIKQKHPFILKSKSTGDWKDMWIYKKR